jgi:hypothetical protein
MAKGNKPIATVRAGKIKIAAWENETKTGKMYTFTPTNSYYDEDKKEWKESSSYSATQLLELKQAINEIYSLVRIKTGDTTQTETKE